VKTIVHITLSDEDRSDLAKRIHRDPDTKHLVTRKEVTETVHALIQREIEDGREPEGHWTDEPEDGPVPDDACRAEDTIGIGTFVASRGDEDYLAEPKDPGIAAACSRILDDTALIEQFAWDTVERNRK